MAEVEHVRVTYNDVHNLIKRASEKIAEWKPNLLIAIGKFFRMKALKCTCCLSTLFSRVGGGSASVSFTCEETSLLY